MATPSAAADSRAARKELSRIERQIEKLASTEAKLHAELAANATDHEQVSALDARLQALLGEKEELEKRWMELADELG